MSEELVTVATYTHPNDSVVAKALLDSEGIMCFLSNANTVLVDPLISNAIGGVQLKVRASDVEKSKALLSQPMEVGEEYTEMFKEDAEDIIYKKEQQELEKRKQNALKWGCIGAIIVLVIIPILMLIISNYL